MKNQREKKFNFENIFVFEMANNHQGQLEHGKRIINEIAKVVEPFGIRSAMKFQFRDIDTFIHPDYKKRKDLKHIPRFVETRLSDKEFKELLMEVKDKGFISVCTPFDEISVDKIIRMDFDIIKVGSCSAHDWPLLEKIAQTGKPVICSIGGLTIKEIDSVVSFFEHRGVDFSLMHCVAIYPVPYNEFHLNQIEIMRNRYPGITVGFSTHEAPDDDSIIQLAYASGARMFEKHIGIETDKIKLNTYSATPAQVGRWLTAYKKAVEVCGDAKERLISEKEKTDLVSLMRGIYAKKDIKKGATIKRSDVFFAMPLLDGQLTSGRWKDNLRADRQYKAKKPLDQSLSSGEKSKTEIIYPITRAIRGMINNAKIVLSHEFSVELSHHYGLEEIEKTGCAIIECINNAEYAKKLIIQLPGQWNPLHYHKKKDETFQVLVGNLTIEISGREKKLEPGDTLRVPRGVWHGFGTEEGVIFEEISSASYNDDSFYVDKKIANLSREERKTYLNNWGRHQFDEVKAKHKKHK